MSSAARRFSIIIPAHNEAANVGRCVHAIRNAQRKADIEDLDIHVVDNCSTDDTVNAATDLGATVHLMSCRVSIAALRNHGARVSSGGVLLFLDADMEAPVNWLETIQHYFLGDRADALGFVERIPRQAPWPARAWSRRILARRSKVMEVDYLPGRNIACRRDFFDRVGGFDATLTTAEDKDFIMRLKREGARVISDPSLEIVHWGYERSLAELARKEFWRQSNNLNLARRHGWRWRLLRFPLLSIAHTGCGALMIGLLLTGRLMWALLATVCWLAPSLLMTLTWRPRRTHWLHVLQLTFLRWMRFNIAGVAMACELFQHLKTARSSRRPA